MASTDVARETGTAAASSAVLAAFAALLAALVALAELPSKPEYKPVAMGVESSATPLCETLVAIVKTQLVMTHEDVKLTQSKYFQTIREID